MCLGDVEDSTKQCFRFQLTGTAEDYGAAFELTEDFSGQSVRGTSATTATTFCILGGAFNAQPSPFPTNTPKPSPEPTPDPTHVPTSEPTAKPTLKPTPQPSRHPSPLPSPLPTPLPTLTCPRGKYVNSNGATCESCDVGRYSNVTYPPYPQGECPLCPAGKVAKTTEASECASCAEGKFSAAER